MKVQTNLKAGSSLLGGSLLGGLLGGSLLGGIGIKAVVVVDVSLFGDKKNGGC